ncbi:hypothetical protein [Paraliomyxa miuraensis]|uniref:hypothetical protein n=1 Tax=Paraliomyxa miuraensis TaxID=376150 RepID=UPI002251F3DD|nr:hypothetical protein [Paraliomyxa miuraensis]
MQTAKQIFKSPSLRDECPPVHLGIDRLGSTRPQRFLVEAHFDHVDAHQRARAVSNHQVVHTYEGQAHLDPPQVHRLIEPAL